MYQEMSSDFALTTTGWQIMDAFRDGFSSRSFTKGYNYGIG